MPKVVSKRRRSDDQDLATHKGVANNEYEIENILFDESFGNKTMYLIKWKNYPMDQCTWEPYRNLTNCQEIMAEYRANKIISCNVSKTGAYIKLFNELNSFADQELMEALHELVNEGIPSIDYEIVCATIAYLSTIAPQNRSRSLSNVARRNLMLIEVGRKRKSQLERLDKWQNSMNLISGFNISVENKVDFEGPPKKFIYVNECVKGAGILMSNDPPLWCSCCNEICGVMKSNKKNCHFNDHPPPYNKHKRIIVSRGTPIFECNKMCTCDESCINRVIQLGPPKTLKLQIFRTDNNRGWGVKTLVPIKQGSYINKYTGEIITRTEADKRAVTHGSKSTYMFDLDYNTEKNKSVYSVDATVFGNVTHFINHSCDANLAIYAAWIDCMDPDLPTLALFASRNIAAGEEITFNYMTSVTGDSRRIKCKCQSNNCQGYLC